MAIQSKIESGANIKTINGASILGAGDIELAAVTAAVMIAGDQAVTGMKTVPTPTADGHIANKKYVDDHGGGFTPPLNSHYGNSDYNQSENEVSMKFYKTNASSRLHLVENEAHIIVKDEDHGDPRNMLDMVTWAGNTLSTQFTKFQSTVDDDTGLSTIQMFASKYDYDMGDKTYIKITCPDEASSSEPYMELYAYRDSNPTVRGPKSIKVTSQDITLPYNMGATALSIATKGYVDGIATYADGWGN